MFLDRELLGPLQPPDCRGDGAAFVLAPCPESDGVVRVLVWSCLWTTVVFASSRHQVSLARSAASGVQRFVDCGGFNVRQGHAQGFSQTAKKYIPKVDVVSTFTAKIHVREHLFVCRLTSTRQSLANTQAAVPGIQGGGLVSCYRSRRQCFVIAFTTKNIFVLL